MKSRRFSGQHGPSEPSQLYLDMLEAQAEQKRRPKTAPRVHVLPGNKHVIRGSMTPKMLDIFRVGAKECFVTNVVTHDPMMPHKTAEKAAGRKGVPSIAPVRPQTALAHKGGPSMAPVRPLTASSPQGRLVSPSLKAGSVGSPTRRPATAMAAMHKHRHDTPDITRLRPGTSLSRVPRRTRPSTGATKRIDNDPPTSAAAPQASVLASKVRMKFEQLDKAKEEKEGAGLNKVHTEREKVLAERVSNAALKEKEKAYDLMRLLEYKQYQVPPTHRQYLVHRQYLTPRQYLTSTGSTWPTGST